MIPMVIFVIGGLFFLKGSNFTPFLKDGMNMNSISAAVITVFYAFTGFENVGVAAGDMENPKKNVPKSTDYFHVNCFCYLFSDTI